MGRAVTTLTSETAMEDQFAHDSAKDDLLILVDGRDRQTGVATKLESHTKGLLHRALSVVILRETAAGTELLLAQRAEGKYHSAGLWANSCCSHPRNGEATVEAAQRRCQEELGMHVEGLEEIGSFAYRAAFENGLVEYEYDHVLLAHATGDPDPDPTEVQATRWVSVDALATDLAHHPTRFCAWAFTVLTLAMERIAKG